MGKGYRVYCPSCGRRLLDYDGKFKSIVKMKCEKCNMLATFSPQTGKATLSSLPLRTSGSGKRFY